MSLKKAGRPKKESSLVKRMDIRMTETEKEKVEKMANYYGKSVSQFVKELIEKQHKEYVKDSFFDSFEFDKN